MKKFIALTTAAALCLSMAACGSSSTAASSTADSAASTEAAGSTEELAIEDVWASGSTVYVDVPAKAGGGTDLYTRYLTQALGEVCPGVNFVVTNYDTGEVGMEHTKNADADGMTLVTCHGGAIIQYLCGSSEVNIKDDLQVVGIMNQGGPQAIITNPDAPYTNFSELAEYIKANPGEVVIGCSLGGTTQVLFTSLIQELVGDTSLVNFVQCSSEADKLTNVASNAINIANCSIPNAQSYEQDGKLTILGTLGPSVATLENMSELTGLELGEEYATTTEQGVNVTWDSNYYVLAPKGTPENVCAAINSAIMQATEVQSFIDGNNAMATYIGAINYEDAKADLAAEWEMQDGLVTSMGLKVR